MILSKLLKEFILKNKIIFFVICKFLILNFVWVKRIELLGFFIGNSCVIFFLV